MSDPTSPQPELGKMPPCVRIAPSPTGDPHVGTAYIALFNYAFARKHGGKFILRIEDTDQSRSSSTSETAIYEALRWLGLNWDEGPDVGGPSGPYRQSERLTIYRDHADRLLSSGAAYRCFCTPQRLDALRKQQEQEGASHRGYDGRCRAIEPAEADARAAQGESHTVRLKVPQQGDTTVIDRLRGEVTFSNLGIDDQVLMKSDGFPTYHLANVVDDHTMGVTHVIRGEDWLTSTPKHVLLYRAFGWDLPQFVHASLLRNPDKSKLSKRKNPVSVFHYRDLGYMPETFVNFLATLGYSMGEDRERFTLDELVEHFELSRLTVKGPIFDFAKLDAFSGDDIRAMSAQALYERVDNHVLAASRIKPLLGLCQERISKLDDFVPYASFFFGGSVDYTAVLPKLRVKKRTVKETIAILKTFIDEVEKDPDARAFTVESLEVFARSFCERHGWKPKELFTLLRIGSTGRTASPPLFDTLAALGKDRVRLRLRDTVAVLKQLPEKT